VFLPLTPKTTDSPIAFSCLGHCFTRQCKGALRSIDFKESTRRLLLRQPPPDCLIEELAVRNEHAGTDARARACGRLLDSMEECSRLQPGLSPRPAGKCGRMGLPWTCSDAGAFRLMWLGTAAAEPGYLARR
jgi:hypothetical protein